MNKSQNNYLSMVNAVCDVFDSNKPLWEGKPLVLASVGRVKSLRDSINDTATRQKNNAPKGHTEAKEAARTMLEDSIFNVGRRLRAFGRLEEDVLAERQATFSRYPRLTLAPQPAEPLPRHR